MKPSKLCFLLAGLLLAFLAEAQKATFGYRRKIDVPANGWYFISLPSDIFKHINPEFNDLRIYETSGNDTLEVPYLVEVQSDRVTEVKVSPPILNKSKREGRLFITFELKKDEQVNYLDLKFEEENFNGFVTLEGSADQKTWFELSKDQRILSIHNNVASFTSSILNFPTTNYRFIRLSIKADKDLTLIEASFRNRKLEAGDFQPIDFTWTTKEDKPSKSTIAELVLKNEQHLGKILIDAHAGGSDFYRSFTLEALRDSVQTEKGWIHYYDRILSDHLISLKPNEFSLNPPPKAKKFRITINNADSPPLQLRNIQVLATDIRLIAKFTKGNNYLLYGNKTALSPVYDLVHFKDKIATDSTSLILGEEEVLVANLQKMSPLFENKLWLWGIMGVVIGLLGFFTIRMMKNK